MTKDELAKKKGKKIEKKQSPAESLLTVKPNLELEEVPNAVIEKKENNQNNQKKKIDATEQSSKVILKPINKLGRPKGKPTTKISLNIPNEYIELIDIASGLKFKGNTTTYIVSLIEKDLKNNGTIYEQIKNMKQI